jgi:hypothetical protein
MLRQAITEALAFSPTQSTSQCRRGEWCTCSCKCDPGPEIADTGWDWRSWPNRKSGPSSVTAGRMGAVAWDWLGISQSRALREKWVSEGATLLGIDETLREPPSHWDESVPLQPCCGLLERRRLPPCPDCSAQPAVDAGIWKFGTLNVRADERKATRADRHADAASSTAVR